MSSSEQLAVIVQRITIYPIKSLPGLSVPEAEVLPSGALRGDRRWAMLDEAGNFVNGKRTERVHAIDARFTEDLTEVHLSVRPTSSSPHPDPATFVIEDQQAELEAWLSSAFEQPIRLVDDQTRGFPDDTAANGPTIIGSKSIEEIATWFEEISCESIRERLRANVELTTPIPFWEDQLFGAKETERPFRIGETDFYGINPCQRCVVVSRDPLTGERLPIFQKRFAQLRKETLPAFASADQFNHFYRAAVNTRLAGQGSGQKIRVQDSVELR